MLLLLLMMMICAAHAMPKMFIMFVCCCVVGKERVLDVMPTAVHQRVPLYIGSKKEVEYLESFTKKA